MAVHLPTYRVWQSMKKRCHSPKAQRFYSHGARGIKVCDRWLESYANFLADMGQRPEGLSLDRINNNGNYEPSNCRWATRSQQQRNRHDNAMVTFGGETLPMSIWEKRFGFGSGTLHYRITKMGWPVERALMTPVRYRRGRSMVGRNRAMETV